MSPRTSLIRYETILEELTFASYGVGFTSSGKMAYKIKKDLMIFYYFSHFFVIFKDNRKMSFFRKEKPLTIWD